jgi:TolB protein
MKYRLFLATAIFALFCGHSARAMVNIDITRGNVDPLPIALPYLPGGDESSANLGKAIAEVIEHDLESSGLFKSINRKAFIQQIDDKDSMPSFPEWRQISAAALVTGGVTITGSDEFKTEFRVWDVYSQQQIAGKSFTTNNKNWRRVGHLIADEVYKRITGESGYFDSRIVYVAESGSALKRKKRLAIIDQDGENHRFLTDGSDLVITPRFSPTSAEVIYMSYATGVPKVYIRNVDTGRTQAVGNFPGMSFAPRFSPDGKTVVMSAESEGDSAIYTMDLASGTKRRITNEDGAIDTSPCFSPDGKKIVFNSDRGGSQQLYVMNADGSGVQRISFSDRGKYGTPVWSPRGDWIAFTKMYNSKFYIGVMRVDGSAERLLTESFLDEGPTWSPNGRLIMFARQDPSYGGKQGAWSIHSIDLTGYNERILKTPTEASDPAWSNLM